MRMRTKLENEIGRTMKEEAKWERKNKLDDWCMI